MSGVILRLLPRTDFDFATVQGSSTVDVWLTQNVDVARYREGTLLVRVHACSIGSGASLLVVLRAVLPTQEDPAQYFRSTSDLVLATVTGSTSPQLLTAALPANFGGFVSLLVRPTQPPTPTTLSATISVELSLKD